MPVMQFCAAALIAAIVVTPVAATDLVPSVEPPSPSAPPIFYVHAGALGGFAQVHAQPTGGGIFGVANVAIRPSYTLDLEAGYFVTPNIAIAVSTSVPPIEHFKATGFPMAGVFGTNLLGSTRAGLAMLLLQYHFTPFGAIQPYAGIGGGYIVNLGNISDGILTNFSLDQNFRRQSNAHSQLGRVCRRQERVPFHRCARVCANYRGACPRSRPCNARSLARGRRHHLQVLDAVADTNLRMGCHRLAVGIGQRYLVLAVALHYYQWRPSYKDEGDVSEEPTFPLTNY